MNKTEKWIHYIAKVFWNGEKKQLTCIMPIEDVADKGIFKKIFLPVALKPCKGRALPSWIAGMAWRLVYTKNEMHSDSRPWMDSYGFWPNKCILSMSQLIGFVFQFFNVFVFNGPKIKSIEIRRDMDVSQIGGWVDLSATSLYFSASWIFFHFV